MRVRAATVGATHVRQRDLIMRCIATADARLATGDAGWQETEASLALEGHSDVVNAVVALFGNTVNDPHTSSLRPHTIVA